MKFKHNKKRNTAFIFEALIKEMVKAVMDKDLQKKEMIASLIKESFNKNSVLGQELELYRSLTDIDSMPPHMAEKIIYESKVKYNSLNKQQVFDEQSTVIKKINKSLGKDVFNNFVPQYKSLATIYQLFNSSDLSPKKKVLLEESIINHLSSKNSKIENKVPGDKLVFNSFIKRFNDEYSGKLRTEQRDLLNKFITSFSDNGLELKIFLNEEICRLREVVENFSTNVKKEDTILVEKANRTLNVIDDFRNQEINTKLIKSILKIQDLANEIVE
jgi:hypothetical protein